MFRTFEARICNCVSISTIDQEKHFDTFTFTRSRILFGPRQTADVYYLDYMEGGAFHHETNYTIEKIYDAKDRKRWLITFESSGQGKSYLQVNWWNEFRCSILHKRYWLQQNYDHVNKAVVTALFAILTGVVVGILTYRAGYQNGVKAGKEEVLLQSQNKAYNSKSKTTLH